MDNNDLRKLNRKQLLELLLKQTVRVEELENQLIEMEQKLDDRILVQQAMACKEREAEAARKIREADMKIAEAEKVMEAVKKSLQKMVAAEQPEDAIDRLFFNILGK